MSEKPTDWDEGKVEDYLTGRNLLESYSRIDKAKVIRAMKDGIIDIEGITLVEEPITAIVMKELLS